MYLYHAVQLDNSSGVCFFYALLITALPARSFYFAFTSFGRIDSLQFYLLVGTFVFFPLLYGSSDAVNNLLSLPTYRLLKEDRLHFLKRLLKSML